MPSAFAAGGQRIDRTDPRDPMQLGDDLHDRPRAPETIVSGDRLLVDGLPCDQAPSANKSRPPVAGENSLA